MNSLTKKIPILFSLFSLIESYPLFSSRESQQMLQVGKNDVLRVPSQKRKILIDHYCNPYQVSKDACFLIMCFIYDNPLRYRKKTLPQDLSERDLSGFDFTGCQFMGNNLTATYLQAVILKNTTCDYRQAFLNNLKRRRNSNGNWYKTNLFKDLESITVIYPQLSDYSQKSKMLHIASAFSQLPFYSGTEFYIQAQYWSLVLLYLKNEVGKVDENQLRCSLEMILKYDAKVNCWTTQYPQNQIELGKKVAHANFSSYLREFQIGLKQYQCESKSISGFSWYKNNIEDSINSLEKAYPNIKPYKLQKEACKIAAGLSKSYQVGGISFLYHYLFYQKWLIRFSHLVGSMVDREIHYRAFRGSLSLPFIAKLIRERKIDYDFNLSSW